MLHSVLCEFHLKSNLSILISLQQELCYSDSESISYFTQTLILRYELLHFLGKVSGTLLHWSLVNFLILAKAAVEPICHFYCTSLPDVLIYDQMLESALMGEDLCAICRNSSNTDTYSYGSCHMQPKSYSSTKGKTNNNK